MTRSARTPGLPGPRHSATEAAYGQVPVLVCKRGHISWVFPAAATVLFWLYKRATPGKMALSAQVVDAETGNSLIVGQLIGRYLAYFLATVPLGFGIIWVAFDPRKQGWHDKLAGTVVVRKKDRRPGPVKFAG